MDKLEKLARLKAMLSQIAPRGEIQEIPKARWSTGITQGLEGLEAAPQPDVHVESGLRKMAEGQSNQVTPIELFPDWPGETFPLFAIKPSRRLPPAKVEAFLNFCTEISRVAQPQLS